MNLEGRTVLLTGAAGALGTATASVLAEAGARLALSDLPGEALEQAAERVGGVALPCDVLDDEQLQALPDRVDGGPDVVISSAGIEFNARFHEVDASDLDRQLAIHLRAPMLLIRAALPGMLARGHGHVVVVSSLNGKIPFPRKVPYAAAKAGSIAMVHALRRDYRDEPVDFSVVMPALVTGGGQAARAMTQAGVDVPRLAPTATAEQCAQAIRDAIVHNRAEVAVSSTPNAPLAALQWAFPRAADRLLEATGMPDFWRRVGDRGRS